MSIEFINGTIRDYVDRASARAEVPGGGSVSALAGALGVTMGCMAANFTIGRKKSRDVEPQVRAILGRLDEARESLLHLTEEDSRAYGRYAAASSMPKDTDEQKAARQAAMQEAIKGAMQPPLETVRVCLGVLRELQALVHVANPYLISDVGVAAILAEAAIRGATLNVQINLSYLKDRPLADAARGEIDAAGVDGGKALAEIGAKVSRAINH